MKSFLLLSLAAASTAFLHPQQVFGSLQAERLPSKEELRNGLEEAAKYLADSADGILHGVSHKASDCLEEGWTKPGHLGKMMSNKDQSFFDGFEDMLYNVETVAEYYDDLVNDGESLGLEDDDAADCPNHRRPPHKKPHHGHKPNLTVYELIAKSKYTTKLAEFINEFPDLVDALNRTDTKYTVFAFSDKAYEKLPDFYKKKPSKKTLEKILSYHVSPDFYPAGRILASRTIPTLLNSSGLGKGAGPQRLGTELSLRGLTINYYSRVIAANIFGTNGVIHGVSTPLLLPPMILDIINLLPGSFSTLELGLFRTDLVEALNATDIKGATLFAPSNWAFKKLGPATNAFLFSHYGLKYLKALIEYHVVPRKMLYSDAYYKADSSKAVFDQDSTVEGVPRGSFRVEVPTLLKDKTILINYARYGRLIDIRLNGASRVSAGDIIAQDGVIHEINGVLIPPRKLANGVLEEWDGDSEISPEELVERLEGLGQ